MELFKKIGNFCLIILACAGGLMSGYYWYYVNYLDTTTIGTTYINDQVGLDIVEIVNSEDMTDAEISEYDERWFMEANYYSNDAENGIEVQELNFNYFTDYTLTSDVYRASGIQNIGDFDENFSDSLSSISYNYTDSMCYYDTTDGISYNGNNLATSLSRDEKYIIKIDNTPYSIQLTGTYSWGFWIFGQTYNYSYLDVFSDCMDAIQTNSKGYGEYYITVDLSTYFTVYKYSEENNDYDVIDADILKNYTVLKFSYYENGLVSANQSLFGTILGNSSYGVNDSVDTNYWQEKAIFTITNDYLDYRYSSINNGYYVSLNKDFTNQLNEMDRTLFYVEIDISNGYNDLPILGIDYNGLENIDIYQLSIIGSGDFTILSKGINNIEYLAVDSGINLILSTDAIISEYTEVSL